MTAYKLAKVGLMRRVVATPFPADPLVTDAKRFGFAVRAARTAAGLTLADAAQLVGVSKQTLGDLETAKSSVGLATALQVARELGVVIFAVRAGDRELVRRLILGARNTESGEGEGER